MRLNRKTLIVLLLVLLTLLVAVAVAGATDVAGADAAVAAADLHGAQGIITNPISSIDQRLISPWGIDATRNPGLVGHDGDLLN